MVCVPGGRVAFPRGIESEPKPRPGTDIVAYDAISDKAHERLAAGHILGKLVLRVR
jgi:hypothetical protein